MRYAVLLALGLFVAACGATTYKCAQGGPYGSCLRYSDEGGASPGTGISAPTSATMGNTLGNGTFR